MSCNKLGDLSGSDDLFDRATSFDNTIQATERVRVKVLRARRCLFREDYGECIRLCNHGKTQERRLGSGNPSFATALKPRELGCNSTTRSPPPVTGRCRCPGAPAGPWESPPCEGACLCLLGSARYLVFVSFSNIGLPSTHISTASRFCDS